jgi:chromosome segregation ATPase
MEFLNSQVDDLKKDLQKCHQLSDDLQEQKNLVSQLKEQHSIESGKQKTKLEDACKHYQNTLKEEQNKLQLVIQDLEVSKSDVGRLQLETTKNQEALEAKESVIVELNGRVSGIEQKLTEAESEILSLEKSHAEVSHLLSIAQNSASKHRSHDPDVQAPQLISARKVTSAGAHSIKTPAVPVKKSIHYVKPFNPSASPPSTTKHRESPKTKKRDRSKVPRNMLLPSNIFPD